MKSTNNEMQSRGGAFMSYVFNSQSRYLMSSFFLITFSTSLFAAEDYGISGRHDLSDRYADLDHQGRTPQQSTSQGQPLQESALSKIDEEIRKVLRKVFTLSNSSAIFPRLSNSNQRGLAAFYGERDYQPLWIEGGQWSSRAVRLIHRLSRADEDALDPDKYHVLQFQDGNPDVESLARADLALTQAVIAYVLDARGARINLAQLSKVINPKLELPEATSILSNLISVPDSEDALAKYNPQHQGYVALKEKLAEFRDYTSAITDDSGNWNSVKKNPNTDIYDKNLKKSSVLAEIIANMERWRWLPSDLGPDRIEVNLPEYTARVFRKGQLVYSTRVIIGKRSTPTPLFSNQMVYLIVNPSWHVPDSIVNNEILPKLAEDPDYATRNGYEITELDTGRISIRQPPGTGNALGLVKFMFPNEHAIYLHDTPNKKLFAHSQRAFSHGCIRVQNPFELAAILLDDGQYSEDRLKEMIGRGERLIPLKAPVPIHLTYFTLRVDENGEIERIPDVYGFDKPLGQVLKASPSRAMATLRFGGD